MLVAYAALGGAVLIWGVSFPVMKFAVARLGPFDVGYTVLQGTVTFASLAFSEGAP